ncbi:MAG TPA: DUF1987 domain-containing protein [Flavobacteriales bacterium]
MERLQLAATDKTPSVLFDPAQGIIELTGCSIHENADRFFRPLIEMAERYALAPASQTTIRLSLSYFNSSSAKYVLDLLKILDEVHVAEQGKVRLDWLYEEDDLDMEEAGNDYRALLSMPVKLLRTS